MLTFRALRPLGLLKGEAADQAIASGHAWRLGGSGACTGLELFCRDERGISASTTSVPAFLARLAGEDEAERAAWLPRLHALSRGSVWPDGLPPPPLIMGIVNVTPDSFHDGGRFMGTERAIEHGRRLAAEGAAIVDVGGESTRPGAAPVPVDEEIRRVLPVVRALAADAIRVSIDTRNAAVMRAALDAGASIINDVTALRHDRAAAPLAAERGVPVILMHMRGDPATMQQAPHYVRACFEVLEFLERRAEDLEAAGLRRDRLILDPGIGFGKTVEHNLDILRHLDLYRCLGRPLALGASRKSFIARLSAGEPTDERLPGSLAVHVLAVNQGAQILRVHDVAATRQALEISRSLTL